MKVCFAIFRKKQSTCGLIMNAVACLILTWLVFELCYDYISDSIKQIFHWCLFKKMFSVKCLFPMLVYEARRSSSAIFFFFHSAFFVMEKWGEEKNAHSCLCGTTFYCLTLSSHHAPPQFLLLGVPIFNVIYFLIHSVKQALGCFCLKTYVFLGSSWR